jgi:hypothetical protein
MEKTRDRLAITLMYSVIIAALISTFVPRANEVFHELLPGLMLTLGYYFGKKS